MRHFPDNIVLSLKETIVNELNSIKEGIGPLRYLIREILD